MFCGQCGKRVLDTMLFCPFCGAPIVIPDQGEPAAPAPRAPEARGERPRAPEAERAEASVAEVAPEVEAKSAPAEPAPEPPAEPEPAPQAESEFAAEPAFDAESEFAAEPAFDAESEFAAESASEAEADSEREHVRAPEDRAEQIFDVEPAPRAKPESPRKSAFETRPGPATVAEFEPLRLEAREHSSKREVARERPVSQNEVGGAKTLARREVARERPVSLFDEAPREEISEPVAPRQRSEAPQRTSPSRPQQRRPAPAKRAPDAGARRAGGSYIPVRDVNPNDMFMDRTHPEEDSYDPYDDDGDDDFSFEEPEAGGFFQRHVRGVVALALTGMLLIIFLIWMMMPAGQRVLAPANLAWRADVYNDLGYAAYESGQFRQAATYFERALARDGDNYDYAHSAMVSYYEAEELDSALAMLKKCIEMNPDSPEPYRELMTLYPDSATRPWEVQELLRLGYERTGDEALQQGA